MRLPVQSSVAALKAMAEPTRLRLLVLLASGELNVKDLTGILGQSQPRISRHLKLLAEAGLVERAPEGSWVYFRLGRGRRRRRAGAPGARGRRPHRCRCSCATGAAPRPCARSARRRRRPTSSPTPASGTASAPCTWPRPRWKPSVSDALGAGPFDLFVDLGTGTGRMLELFRERYRRGLGIDLSPAMLAYARAKLERGGPAHAQVRQGDIYDLPLADQTVGAVVMHQVLHFLSDPQRAVREAARVLAPGGRLLIVDFAPHELEFLREQYAHERLGFADPQVGQWLADCGLELVETRELVSGDHAGTANLTVSVWLARRPQMPRRRRRCRG